MITGIDKSVNLLEKMLDVSATKHKVIANNIANINTPGYKKMEVSFAERRYETGETVCALSFLHGRRRVGSESSLATNMH